MNILIILGGFFCIVGYALTSEHLRKNKEDQAISFSSFLLWAILDFITALSIACEGGKTTLPILFTIGSTIIAFLLFIQGKKKWQPFDWVVSLLIFLCLCVWGVSKDNMLTTLSALGAVIIASFPQVKSSFEHPDKKTLKIWIAFLTANIFFALEPESNWSNYESLIIDRMCPIVNGLMCLMVLAFNMRAKKKRTH